MTEHGKVQLKLYTSGIPALDSILGGGFPEYSCNLIAGDPGSGKTTYRLTNIVRAEPSPNLFEPPPDFRVVEPGATAGTTIQASYTYVQQSAANIALDFGKLGAGTTDVTDIEGKVSVSVAGFETTSVCVPDAPPRVRLLMVTLETLVLIVTT